MWAVYGGGGMYVGVCTPMRAYVWVLSCRYVCEVWVCRRVYGYMPQCMWVHMHAYMSVYAGMHVGTSKSAKRLALKGVILTLSMSLLL